MNRSQAQEIWFLIKAFGEGVVTQWSVDREYWEDKTELDVFNLCECPHEYRIKPEPEEIWVNHYHNGCPCVYESVHAAINAAHGKETNYDYIAKRFVEADEDE